MPHSKLLGTAPCPGQEEFKLDFDLSSYAGAPFVSVSGHRYFAAGLKAMVLLISQMTPRPGEVQALCRDQIDWDAQKIAWDIHSQPFKGKIGGRSLPPTVDGTKGSSPGRKLQRSPYRTDEVARALSEWLAIRDVVADKLGSVLPQKDRGGIAFPSVCGKMMSPPTMTSLFRAMEKAAGVPLAAVNESRDTEESTNYALHVLEEETAQSQGHSVRVARQRYTRPQET
jgi:integrase